MSDPLDLDPIKKRQNIASGKGPWTSEEYDEFQEAQQLLAEQDVPALLQEVERLRYELAALRTVDLVGRSAVPYCGFTGCYMTAPHAHETTIGVMAALKCERCGCTPSVIFSTPRGQRCGGCQAQ